MRFLPALLFLALTGSVALAEDASPPSSDAKPADAKPEAAAPVAKRRVPFRVVRMLPETRQVLLFDKTKGTHVVAEVGQDVEGYLVDDIDDDEVTLVAPSGAEIILTAPDMTWRRRQAEKNAKAKAPAAADAAPEDPYADPATPATATASPIVAGADGVRVASATGATVTPDAEPAPADPYGDPGVAAFFEAVGATPPAASSPSATPSGSPATTKAPAASKPTTSSSDGAALGAALTGSPAPASAPSASSSATGTAGPTTATIKRSDIDLALGNFAATAATFKATFTAQGLRFDDVVTESLIARVGLQKGDVITTVDGQPLRSLDDAANLYARLPTARGSTIQVLRAGKPMTLRIAIQ
ncbi:MAG TPA: PDZ domain-containing protein [Kofleriaceae bacterium]|nr:PDZ domain-containing protein [Kofleriaceae bacterium]